MNGNNIDEYLKQAASLTPKELGKVSIEIFETLGQQAMDEFLKKAGEIREEARSNTPPPAEASGKSEKDTGLDESGKSTVKGLPHKGKQNAKTAGKRENNTGKTIGDTFASALGATLEGEIVPDLTEDGREFSDTVREVIDRSPVPDKSVPAIRLRSLRDAVKMIQQPKTLIFGRYDLNEKGHDLLTMIGIETQKYMTRNLSLLKPDIVGDVTLRIDTEQFMPTQSKKKAVEELEKFMNTKFEFHWMNDRAPAGTEKIQTKGYIVPSYHNYVGTSYVDLMINKWSLPFLAFYGNGSGSIYFDPQTAMKIKGKYAKQLYKVFCGYADSPHPEFTYSMDKFREDYFISTSYTPAKIVSAVIKPAVKAINAENKFFTTGFTVTKRPVPGKKPVIDKITFTFEMSSAPGTDNQPPREFVSEDEMERSMKGWLRDLVEPRFRDRLTTEIRTWRNHGDLPHLYGKTKYYITLSREGKMTPEKARNTILKIIETDTGTVLKTKRRHKPKENV